jgi:hypothetical protein
MYALRKTTIRKGLLFSLLMLLCLLVCLVVAQPTFAATHTTAQPSVSCYGQAKPIGPYIIRITDFVIITTYTTTTHCRDINFKATRQAGPTLARVIFKDVKTGKVKGYGAWKRISSTNTWYVLASNVLNGTHFTLEFKVPYKGTTFAGQMAS